MKYKVTFTETNGYTTTHICNVSSESQIIEFYGLNEPDILDYKIEEICE